MKSITFSIPGPPQGKARPKVVRNKYTGKSMSYTPDKTVAYEELTRLRYRAAAHGFIYPEGAYLRVTILAGYPVPKSASKKKRAEMLAEEIRPDKKPDIDNIQKIIMDALNGIAYPDDKQVIQSVSEKKYVDGAGETLVRLQEI